MLILAEGRFGPLTSKTANGVIAYMRERVVAVGHRTIQALDRYLRLRPKHAYAAEPWLQRRFNHEVEQHRSARYRTLRLLALQHPVVGFLEALGILTVLLIGAWRIQSGQLDGQGLSSYVAALLMLMFVTLIPALLIRRKQLREGGAE